MTQLPRTPKNDFSDEVSEKTSTVAPPRCFPEENFPEREPI